MEGEETGRRSEERRERDRQREKSSISKGCNEKEYFFFATVNIWPGQLSGAKENYSTGQTEILSIYDHHSLTLPCPLSFPSLPMILND